METHFDVAVLGTGLTESIAAAYARTSEVFASDLLISSLSKCISKGRLRCASHRQTSMVWCSRSKFSTSWNSRSHSKTRKQDSRPSAAHLSFVACYPWSPFKIILALPGTIHNTSKRCPYLQLDWFRCVEVRRVQATSENRGFHRRKVSKRPK